MKNRSKIFLVLFFLSNTLWSQSNYFISDKDSLEYLFIYDSDTLKQINYSFYKPRHYAKRERLLLLNESILDSTGLRFELTPSFSNNELVGFCFDRDLGTKVLTIRFQDHSLKAEIKSSVNLFNSQFPYGIESNGTSHSRVIVKLGGSEILTVADFNNLLGIQEPPGIPEIIHRIISNEPNSIIVECAYCDGGCYLFRYFEIFNGKINELKFDKYRMKNVESISDEYESFRLNFYFSHSDFDFLIAAVDYGNIPENTDLIFSKNLRDTTHILKKSQPWKVIGENVQNDKNQFFYLRSKLDNGEKIVINYWVSRDFERLAYQTFNGRLIEKDQIQRLEADQLVVLKNLVFAKHNYAFDSPFYQAYFNLFSFYNDDEKRKNRTKDMTGLLSETDLNNLGIIKKALKKFE